MAITKNSADSNVQIVDGSGNAQDFGGGALRANVSASTTGEVVLIAATASQSIYVMGLVVNSGADNPFTLGSKIAATTTDAIGGLRANIDGVPQLWPVTPNVDTAWFKTDSSGAFVVTQTAATAQDYDIVYKKK